MGGTITSVLGFRSFAPLSPRVVERRVSEQKVVFASGDTTTGPTRGASLAGAIEAQKRRFTGNSAN